jgi:hypothetical protein
MNKTKQIITAVILSAALLPAVSIKADTVRTNTASEVNVQNVIKQKKNLLHTQLDEYGRPYKSTFIGNDGFQEGKRVGKPEEPTNLKGKWKNQKLDPKTYLWDRGHLVGNQFAGNPSNVSDNIVGQTSYTNQKLMTYFEGGLKSSNENALDNWLYLHPNYYIEYIVTANYESSLDQYPRSITLRFRGLDKQGNPIRIKLPDSKLEGIGSQKEEADEFTSVTIDNFYPGYQIDYKTGKATPYSGAITNNRDTATADRDESDTTGVIEGEKLKELKDNAKSIGDSVKNKGEEVKGHVEKSMNWFQRVMDFFGRMFRG